MWTQALDLSPVSAAALAEIPAATVQHGEVFTKPWVVGMILDLVDYRSDRDLATLRLVEPACGTGAFLGVIARRVSESCRKNERSILEAVDAVRACDLLPWNVVKAKETIESVLLDEAWAPGEVSKIIKSWVMRADYLLEPAAEYSTDFVVGNPPYIRLEDVPNERTSLYRALWPTMVGRADIYIGFFEAALRSLRDGGRLGFICADRWMRNQYGRELRKLVSSDFAVDACVSMHEVDAFEEHVSAYPAVTVIRRARQESAVVVDTTRHFDDQAALEVTQWIKSGNGYTAGSEAYELARLPHWFPGDDLWPTGSPVRLAMLEDLAERFTPIGHPVSGIRVGIGVATGADKVFITRDPDTVEGDRLLPLAMVRDTASGVLTWSGSYLVNPWGADGRLVELDDFPRLRRYFEQHSDALRHRHVAKRNQDRWYRTIDKVEESLTTKSKLLFPDMKLHSHPVLDQGGFYPHHNLYYITSDSWDLRVLGGLLLSRVADAFIDAYAVKMRGRTLRYQAQYLRRIPVPRFDAITPDQASRLSDAFSRRDVAAATSASLEIYGLDDWPEDMRLALHM